jgi:hypothetical protein
VFAALTCTIGLLVSVFERERLVGGTTFSEGPQFKSGLAACLSGRWRGLCVSSVPLGNLQISSICFLVHYLLIGPSEQLEVSFNESAIFL